jgi:tetratricopeptide (TPR) repeat protein
MDASLTLDYSAPARSIEWRPCALGLAIVAITLFAYIPAMHGGFIWDDPDYVVNNATLRTLRGLWNIWAHPTTLPQFYPLVHTTFWVEFHLWALNPIGYHIDNIILHAIGALLLWRVLETIELPGAWLAAAIWAVHPVNVESVAWITERKNVLSGVMYFAAALVYLRGMDRPGWGFAKGRYWLALALFVGALLSKSVTCSLPAALLLVIWWKRGRPRWRDVALVAPMFVLGAAMAAWTAHLEVHHVGASGAEWHYSLAQRTIIAGSALWFYAAKVIAPVRLSFVYPQWTQIDPHHLVQWLWPVSVLLVLAALFVLRSRIGRGPLVAVLFFAGTALPALGFVNIYPMRYTFVADHYVYLADIGLIALIAGILASLLHRRLSWIAPILLAPLIVLTFMRARAFQNSLALWQDTAAKNPDSWMVHVNLGKALAQVGDNNGARQQFHRALELAPGLPVTHWNFGVALAARGRYDEAMRQYDAALRIDPKYPGALYGRGNVYRDLGNYPAAKAEYEKAIDAFPEYGAAHENLGFVLEKLGDEDAAIGQYQRALYDEPTLAVAGYNLGNIYLKRRLYPQAIDAYMRSLQADARQAAVWTNLGNALLLSHRPQDAITAYRRALNIDPTFENARKGLQSAQRRAF